MTLFEILERRPRNRHQQRLLHPAVGRMRLNWDSFTYTGTTDQQLVLWSAPANTPDAASLRALHDLRA